MIPAELQKIVDKNGCLIDHHSISYKNIWIADFYDVDSNDSSLYHVAFMYFDKDDVPKISEDNNINWYLSTLKKRTIKQIDEKLNELVNYHMFKNDAASIFISQSLPLSWTLVVRSESNGINFLCSGGTNFKPKYNIFVAA